MGLSIALFSLFFTLSAFAISANAVPPLISTLVLWIIPLGLAGGAVETFASIQISALSDPGSSKNLCLSQVFYSLGAFAAPQLV